jgi:hypothetical protein
MSFARGSQPDFCFVGCDNSDSDSLAVAGKISCTSTHTFLFHMLYSALFIHDRNDVVGGGFCCGT